MKTLVGAIVILLVVGALCKGAGKRHDKQTHGRKAQGKITDQQAEVLEQCAERFGPMDDDLNAYTGTEQTEIDAHVRKCVAACYYQLGDLIADRKFIKDVFIESLEILNVSYEEASKEADECEAKIEAAAPQNICDLAAVINRCLENYDSHP